MPRNLALMQARKPDQTLPTVHRAMAWFDQLERNLCLTFNRGARQPGVRTLFATVSRLGDGIFWYLLMLALPLLQGHNGLKISLQMAIAGIVGLAIYKLLKSKLVRERPFASHADILCGTAPLDRYSFPSGHTLHAVLFTTLAVSAFPGLAIVLVPFATLVALSRVILGLHYPTDVVVGAALGLGLAQLTLALFGSGI